MVWHGGPPSKDVVGVTGAIRMAPEATRQRMLRRREATSAEPAITMTPASAIIGVVLRPPVSGKPFPPEPRSVVVLAEIVVLGTAVVVVGATVVVVGAIVVVVVAAGSLIVTSMFCDWATGNGPLRASKSIDELTLTKPAVGAAVAVTVAVIE